MNGVKKNKTLSQIILLLLIPGVSGPVRTHCWAASSWARAPCALLSLQGPKGSQRMHPTVSMRMALPVLLGTRELWKPTWNRLRSSLPLFRVEVGKGGGGRKTAEERTNHRTKSGKHHILKALNVGTGFRGAVWWPGPGRWSCLSSSFLSLVFLSNAIFLLLLPFHFHVLFPFFPLSLLIS